MEAPIAGSRIEQQESSRRQAEELPLTLALNVAGASSQSDTSPHRESSQPWDDAIQRLPSSVRDLPVQLDIRVPLTSFRIGDLVALTAGTVLETKWPASEDLPLGSGGVQLLWAEFEVVDERLAARITRVA